MMSKPTGQRASPSQACDLLDEQFVRTVVSAIDPKSLLHDGSDSTAELDDVPPTRVVNRKKVVARKAARGRRRTKKRLRKDQTGIRGPNVVRGNVVSDSEQTTKADSMQTKLLGSDAVLDSRSPTNPGTVPKEIVIRHIVPFAGTLAEVITKARSSLDHWVSTSSGDADVMEKAHTFTETLDLCGEIKSKAAEKAMVAMINDAWEEIMTGACTAHGSPSCDSDIESILEED